MTPDDIHTAVQKEVHKIVAKHEFNLNLLVTVCAMLCATCCVVTVATACAVMTTIMHLQTISVPQNSVQPKPKLLIETQNKQENSMGNKNTKPEVFQIPWRDDRSTSEDTAFRRGLPLPHTHRNNVACTHDHCLCELCAMWLDIGHGDA